MNRFLVALVVALTLFCEGRSNFARSEYPGYSVSMRYLSSSPISAPSPRSSSSSNAPSPYSLDAGQLAPGPGSSSQISESGSPPNEDYDEPPSYSGDKPPSDSSDDPPSGWDYQPPSPDTPDNEEGDDSSYSDDSNEGENSSPSDDSNPPPTAPETGKKSTISAGGVAGIVIGLGVATSAVFLAVWIIQTRRRNLARANYARATGDLEMHWVR